MASKQAPVTIEQLAAHLGVHKSTVSRAMDPARRHMISAELLQRVETAARELGWQPNRAAAALSTGKSRTVGVLLPDITNPVFPPILRGIEDALESEGYFALLANTALFREELARRNLRVSGDTHIVPLLLGDDQAAVALSERLKQGGDLGMLALGVVCVDQLAPAGHRQPKVVVGRRFPTGVPGLEPAGHPKVDAEPGAARETKGHLLGRGE